MTIIINTGTSQGSVYVTVTGERDKLALSIVDDDDHVKINMPLKQARQLGDELNRLAPDMSEDQPRESLLKVQQVKPSTTAVDGS